MTGEPDGLDKPTELLFVFCKAIPLQDVKTIRKDCFTSIYPTMS